MSLLFPLSVIGAGTQNVEAMSSYLLRLAIAHTATPFTFLSLVVEGHCWPDTSHLHGIRNTPMSSFIRPNDSTRLVVESVASGLSVPPSYLEQTTFLALGNALNRSPMAYSRDFRWCPACLSEQINRGEPYFQLAWQVLAVETCDVHRVRLQRTCSRCGRGQERSRLRRSLAECVFCGARLDRLTRKDISRDVYAKDIRSVVEHIATHPGARFPQHGIGNALRGLVDEAWDHGDHEAFYRALPRYECARIFDQTEPLTLTSALRVAFRLNIPLIDLLLGRLQGTNRTIFWGVKEELPTAIRPWRRTRIDDVEALSIKIKRFVHATTKPLSLREVALKLGVSVGALRYHLPTQSEEIVRNYLSGCQRSLTYKSRLCRSNVRKAIVLWNRFENRPLSKKALLRAIRANTGLPKNMLRKEIERQTALAIAAGQAGTKSRPLHRDGAYDI